MADENFDWTNDDAIAERFGDPDARLEQKHKITPPRGKMLSLELSELKKKMLDTADGTYARVPEGLIFYIMAEIDKQIGKPMRLEFLRWCFHRPEITTSHIALEGNSGYDGEIFNSEAEALRLWAIPYKGSEPGAKWRLLNDKFHHQLNLFLVEVMGQMTMKELEIKEAKPEDYEPPF